MSKNITDVENSTIKQLFEKMQVESLESPPPKDLQFHLTALLQAKSSSYKKSPAKINRRSKKIQHKERAPQIKFVEKVLYKTNKDLVTEFLSIPSNLFLLRIFTEANGLDYTDPSKPNTPPCRKRELLRMLDFSKHRR